MKLVFILMLSLNLSGCIGVIPLAVWEYNYRNQLEAQCQLNTTETVKGPDAA